MKLLDVDAAVRNDDMRQQQPEAVICEDAFKDRFWPRAVLVDRPMTTQSGLPEKSEQ
ncbi:MAG: hypothetical protein QHC88_12115 [Achromobacter sp.]|uniref:hypothetical protein n=1 Tax=Achromobacter sp. TaxID=134375 RepID=UPI0029A1F68D|nr:hypothetical protein [Achromobacter sp.]MDX3985987.1 hypothetical protein [Achromobacter sp.]